MKRKKNKRSKRVVILAGDYNLSGKRKAEKLADCEIGRCVDCGEPFLIRDEYIVRGAVWRKAGMEVWDSGYLHIACLEAR